MRMRWVTLLVVGTLIGCGSSNHGTSSDGGNSDGGADNGGGSGVGGGGTGSGGTGGGGGSSTSCAGSTIHSDAELRALAECIEIKGTLELTGAAVTAVSLPKLTRVSDALSIHDVDAATAISLPALTDAGSLVLDGAATLATLELPALAHVGGDLWLGSRTVVSRRLPALEAVKLPALRTVGGQLHIVEVEATEIA